MIEEPVSLTTISRRLVGDSLFLLEMEFHSVTHAEVQWLDLGSLQPLPLGFK